MNLTTARTTLGDLLEVDTTRYPVTVRTLHINQAERKLSALYYAPWTEVELSLTLTSGTALYSLKCGGGLIDAVSSPQEADELDVDLVDSILWTDSALDVQNEIEHRSREELLARYPLAAEDGEPKQYAFWGQTLRIGPPPDDDYEITLTGRGHSPEMSADTDTAAWLTAAPLIVIYCAAELAAEWLMEPDLAAIYAKRWEEEAEAMDILQAFRETEGRDSYAHEYE